MKKFFNVLSFAMLASSINADAQWSAVRFDQHNIFQNVHNPTADNVFVLGTEPLNYDCFLIRSNDSGDTWDSIAFNTAADTYQFSELYFVDANNGFVGGVQNNTNQSLMKSTDNGSTWTDATPDPTSSESISALFFVDAVNGFATAANMLYATNDGGTSWTSISLGFTPYDLNFLDASVGYAAGTLATAPGSVGVVMKTTDGGFTWTEVFNAVDPFAFTNACDHLNALNAYVAFASQPYTNKIFRTMDGGATWSTITCDSVYDILDFQFISPYAGQVLSSYGQLYSTDDGGVTWHLEYATAWAFYGPSNYFYSLSFAEGVGFVCGTSGLVKRFEKNQTLVVTPDIKPAAFRVFPNPAANTQRLSLETHGVSGDVVLSIVNALGQIVYAEHKNDLVEGDALTLPVGLSLAHGVYQVVLQTSTNVYTAKVAVE